MTGADSQRLRPAPRTNLLSFCGRVAENRCHELAQLPRAEGLGKIAIDADLLCSLALRRLIGCREKYHASVCASRIATNTPADLDAVDTPWQHQVEENQVGCLALDFVECAGSVDSLDKFVVGAAEREGDQLSQVGMVINDEYSRLRHWLNPLWQQLTVSGNPGTLPKDELCMDW